MESHEKITFKVGNSFIVIHAGGIDINGPIINIGPIVNIGEAGSPSSVKAPINPEVLIALAGSGIPFIERCPVDTTVKVSPPLDEFQKVFILKNEDGKPLANMKYKLTRESGEEIEGLTDKDGLTERIITDKPEKIKLECFE